MKHNLQKSIILEKLFGLIIRLQSESENFLERQGDLQQWYNRGYADGMLKGLQELGCCEQIPAGVRTDAADAVAGCRWLPWGRAYHHGSEKGRREAHEALQNPD